MGTGMGELALLEGLLFLVPIGGRAGAGRLVDGCFADTATAPGMLLGLAVAAGGPGGGGAGRRRGIERGGGGRGGGGRDLPFRLTFSARCSLASLPLDGVADTLTAFSALSSDWLGYTAGSSSRW